jgi:diacylglycerol kinase (ATP)
VKKSRIRFIINPTAGKGKGGAIRGLIEELFGEHHSDFEMVMTTGRNHAFEIATESSHSNFQTVVAVGGDGTINEVARGLIGSNIALAIVPMGSGNGFARHHRIPMQPAKALDVVKNGKVVNQDMTLINQLPSFNVSGIGFDARVAHLFGMDGKRGFSEYIKLVLQEFNAWTNTTFHIQSGNDTYSISAALLSICTASQYGNGAKIAPAASTMDGIAELVAVRKMSALKLPGFFYRIFNGSVSSSPYTSTWPVKKAVITTETPMPLHIDGEPMGYGREFKIESQSSAIKLIVP